MGDDRVGGRAPRRPQPGNHPPRAPHRRARRPPQQPLARVQPANQHKRRKQVGQQHPAATVPHRGRGASHLMPGVGGGQRGSHREGHVENNLDGRDDAQQPASGQPSRRWPPAAARREHHRADRDQYGRGVAVGQHMCRDGKSDAQSGDGTCPQEPTGYGRGPRPALTIGAARCWRRTEGVPATGHPTSIHARHRPPPQPLAANAHLAVRIAVESSPSPVSSTGSDR